MTVRIGEYEITNILHLGRRGILIEVKFGKNEKERCIFSLEQFYKLIHDFYESFR